MKTIVVSIASGIILTVLVLLLASLPSSHINPAGILLLPFYMFGSLVSGNTHQPNETVAILSLATFLSLVSFVAFKIAYKLFGRGHKN